MDPRYAAASPHVTYSCAGVDSRYFTSAVKKQMLQTSREWLWGLESFPMAYGFIFRR